MRGRRFTVTTGGLLVAACGFVAVQGVSFGQAPAGGEAKPYNLNVKFAGLVSFVPVDRVIKDEKDTARELWVLLPNAVDPKLIRGLKPKIRNYDKFQAAEDLEHAPHYPFLRMRVADLVSELPSQQPNGNVYVALAAEDVLNPDEERPGRYDLSIETSPTTTGRVTLAKNFNLVQPVQDDSRAVAHACPGCLSSRPPDQVNGTEIPLVGRTAFRSGESADASLHLRRHAAVERAEGDGSNIAEDVTVTRPGVRGPTIIRLRKLGTQETKYVFTLRPADGKNLLVEVVNLTAQELLGMPHEPPPSSVKEYFHFKLFYLIAPKAERGTGERVWNYEKYSAPGSRNGDPFCTPPSQLEP